MNASTPDFATGADSLGKNQATGIGWALGCAAAALPWLLPTHAEPWTMFYSEVSMAAALVLLALWACVVGNGPWRIGTLVVAFAFLACVPALQAIGGLFVFPGEAVLIGLYLLGFAMTMAVAGRAQELAPLRLADTMFASLAIAALLSAGMALYQWLGLDTLGLMVAPAMQGGRPVANVGQPNNLSTLLVWGLVAVWWGHLRRRLGGGTALFAAAFLLLGVALTQSRSGWLAVAFLALAPVAYRRVLCTGRHAAALALLALWFVLLVVALEPLGHALFREAPLSLGDQIAPGKRPAIWAMALDAIGQSPWWGYGWNQSVQAHVALARDYPQLQVAVAHAHNLLLDLMLWSGLPLGILIAGALGMWLWQQCRAVATPDQALLLLAVSVLLLHAMLEMPHVYAFFLLPVAVMVGTLDALRPSPTVLSLPRSAIALLVVAVGALLAQMFVEYGRIEKDLFAYRMRQARIGSLVPAPAPDLVVLQPLQTALELLRMPARREMTPNELDLLRRTVTRYPAYGGLFRYAHASAINGRPIEAAWALALLCDLHRPELCEASVNEWHALAAQGNAEMNAVSLPVVESFKSHPAGDD